MTQGNHTYSYEIELNNKVNFETSAGQEVITHIRKNLADITQLLKNGIIDRVVFIQYVSKKDPPTALEIAAKEWLKTLTPYLLSPGITNIWGDKGVRGNINIRSDGNSYSSVLFLVIDRLFDERFLQHQIISFTERLAIQLDLNPEWPKQLRLRIDVSNLQIGILRTEYNLGNQLNSWELINKSYQEKALQLVEKSDQRVHKIYAQGYTLSEVDSEWEDPTGGKFERYIKYLTLDFTK